jgi:hypothetical protein
VIASSCFDKEPGTLLPENLKRIAFNMLNVVRPQLFLIKDQYFGGKEGPLSPGAFGGFLGFPLNAGYTLGFLGAFLQHRAISMSENNILRSVIDVHNDFLANGFDLELSVHYTMQQSSFKFGLDIGAADFSVRSQQPVLLAASSQLFLKYDDERTLKLNLQLFCKGHGVPPRDDHTVDEIIQRWQTQKRIQHDLNVSVTALVGKAGLMSRHTADEPSQSLCSAIAAHPLGRADCLSSVDFQALCRDLKGAFPDLVRRGFKGTIRSGEPALPYNRAKFDLSAPEPSPVDFDWRFDDPTASQLAETLMSGIVRIAANAS